MKKKIAIIAGGNSGIDYFNYPEDLQIFRCTVIVNQKEYLDYVDLNAEDFYNKLREDPSVDVSTAQPATGYMLKVFEQLKSEGFTHAICIVISSNLSGTYQGVKMANNMIDDFEAIAFDSRTVSYPQAYMIQTACEMVSKKNDLNEIIEELERIRNHNSIVFAVSTLKFLVKNGRLSGASGFVGGLLKIKPLLRITAEGRVEAVEKIRTYSKALARVLEIHHEETANKKVHTFIVHGGNEKEANRVKALIQEKNKNIDDIAICPLTPVVGAHAGPDVIGIGYIVLKN